MVTRVVGEQKWTLSPSILPSLLPTCLSPFFPTFLLFFFPFSNVSSVRHVFCLETHILETQVIDQIIKLLLHQNAMCSYPATTVRIHCPSMENKKKASSSAVRTEASSMPDKCSELYTISKYLSEQEYGRLHVKLMVVI